LENTGNIFEDELQREKVGMLLTEIWKTYSTDQRHEISDWSIHELKKTWSLWMKWSAC